MDAKLAKNIAKLLCYSDDFIVKISTFRLKVEIENCVQKFWSIFLVFYYNDTGSYFQTNFMRKSLCKSYIDCVVQLSYPICDLVLLAPS